MQDWLSMRAADLGRGIGAGEIDPVALTEAYLDAIRQNEHRDRIYSAVTETRALAEARAAKERAVAGLRLGILDGVPISWKDLFDTGGTVTAAGSALLEGRVPDRDAKVLRVATMSGLVCLGKTHMSELAFSGLGLNPVTATPPNLHDQGAVPGGSSSGAAASVAFGLAACGIGSDTGGSVRIPAAWNDMVGLKTTSGRLSLDGVVPLCAKFDTVGPLARSVEDCALMLAALEGGKPADLRGTSVVGKRFAALQNVVLEDVRDAPMRAYLDALERLREAGAVIDNIEAPEATEAMTLSGILFTAEAYGTWGDLIEKAPQKMFAPILERFRSGKSYLAPDYVAGWHKLEALRATWHARMAGYDGVLMPTAPNTPPNLQRLLSDEQYYVTENLLALRNTRVGNLMGICAVTVPVGVPGTGLMICGKPFAEEALLRVAQSVEALFSAA